MELQGKVAVVTGGGSGIGEATAKLFAREGAKVVIVARTQEDLDRVAEEIRRDGGEVLAVAGDVSKSEDVERVYAETARRWGRLDVVFAHAGVNGVWTAIEDLDVEEWEQTIRINLTGTFLTVKHAVPLLKERGGAVVITSSVNGTRLFNNAGASAYSSSKAGQIAFMKHMALELAKHRIRVNAVCPGWIETDIDERTEQRNTEEAEEPAEYPEGSVPLTDGEPGSSEQVAQLVLFLASDRASHITGTPVWIDGAESLLE